jgi:hypothetical protein
MAEAYSTALDLGVQPGHHVLEARCLELLEVDDVDPEPAGQLAPVGQQLADDLVVGVPQPGTPLGLVVFDDLDLVPGREVGDDGGQLLPGLLELGEESIDRTGRHGHAAGEVIGVAVQDPVDLGVPARELPLQRFGYQGRGHPLDHVVVDLLLAHGDGDLGPLDHVLALPAMPPQGDQVDVLGELHVLDVDRLAPQGAGFGLGHGHAHVGSST